jgi:hypothetical protein
MAERKRRYILKCRECNAEYKAKKPDAMYCSEKCKQSARYKKYKAIKKMEEEGPCEIDPYFLRRGETFTSLSTGFSQIGGGN